MKLDLLFFYLWVLMQAYVKNLERYLGMKKWNYIQESELKIIISVFFILFIDLFILMQKNLFSLIIL